MDRRKFLLNGGMGVSALVVGSSLPWFKDSEAWAAPLVQSLKFTITDAIKEMVTHNQINNAHCYYWVFKEERFPADMPGPIVYTTEGEEIEVTVTNALDENHAFFIKNVVNSGPIAPGQTRNFKFMAPTAGTYLYYDNLNEPVNRVMGLHGALVVMPKARTGKRFTPYSNPTQEVQNLFDDLGTNPLFPGLAWEEGDPATHTPAFRQHVWLIQGSSPVLFAEVGKFPPGQDFPAERFVQGFHNDPYANTFETGVFNRKPHFWTINGQSGFFSHANPYITPNRRIGEPVLIRIIITGLNTHTLHLHANHYFVTSINNVVRDNIQIVDTHHADPLQPIDMVIPYVRPPDIPNERGIGRADKPLISVRGRPVWPPVEEMNLFFPGENDEFPVRLSPLFFPMHDHLEPTQSAQGGNYPLGAVSGMTVTGDRNTPGYMNFPNYPHEFDVGTLEQTGPAAPLIPHHHKKINS